MRLQTIIQQDLGKLHTIRDEICLQMVEAEPKQLSKLESKLKDIEEAIMLKESGYETEESV